MSDAGGARRVPQTRTALLAGLGAFVFWGHAPLYWKLLGRVGADEVIDYTSQDVTAESARFDAVFDTIGHLDFGLARGILRRGGRYLTTVLSVRILLQMLSTRLVGDKRAIFAATGLASPMEKREHLHTLRDLVESESFRLVIDRAYSLDDIADAHRYVDTGHKVGSVVVTVE